MKKWLVLFFILSLSVCKKKNSTYGVSNYSSTDLSADYQTLVATIAKIDFLSSPYLIPIPNEKGELSVKLLSDNIEKTTPIQRPEGCELDEWSIDNRWGNKDLVEVLQRLYSEKELRVRTFAFTQISKMTQNHGLICHEEFLTVLAKNVFRIDGEAEIKKNYNYALCNSFYSCSLSVNALGDFYIQYPQNQNIAAMWMQLKKDIDNMVSTYNPTLAKLLRYRYKSYDAKVKMQSLIADLTNNNGVYFRDAKADDVKYNEVKNELLNLKKYGQSNLVLAMDNLKDLEKDPQQVGLVLLRDFVGVDKIALLEKESGNAAIEFLRNELTGILQSAMNLYYLDLAALEYLPRLLVARGNPSDFLNSIKNKVDNHNSQVSSFNLTVDNDENQLNPLIAFLTLTQYAQYETKLAFRDDWSNIVTYIYNSIPAQEQNDFIESERNKFQTAVSMFSTTAGNLFQKVGAFKEIAKQKNIESPVEQSLQGASDKDKVLAENAKVTTFLNQLVLEEKQYIRIFPYYFSLYDDLVTLQKQSLKLNNLYVSVTGELNDGSKSRLTSERVVAIKREIAREQGDLMAHWIKLKCLHLIANSKDGMAQIDNENFPLINGMKINLNCGEMSTGENLYEVRRIEKLAASYTSKLEFAVIKEDIRYNQYMLVSNFVMFGAGFVIGPASGLISNVVGGLAKAAISRLTVAALQKVLTNRILNFVGVKGFQLMVSFALFTSINAYIIDPALLNAMGLPVPQSGSSSMSMKLFTATTGISAFAANMLVDPLAEWMAQKSPLIKVAMKVIQKSSIANDAVKQGLRQGVSFHIQNQIINGALDIGVNLATPYAIQAAGYSTGQIKKPQGVDAALSKLYAPTFDQNLQWAWEGAAIFRVLNIAQMRIMYRAPGGGTHLPSYDFISAMRSHAMSDLDISSASNEVILRSYNAKNREILAQMEFSEFEELKKISFAGDPSKTLHDAALNVIDPDLIKSQSGVNQESIELYQKLYDLVLKQKNLDQSKILLMSM